MTSPTDSHDRTTLKNCHLHSSDECDAAARRMSTSADWPDRELGRLWLAARSLA